MKRRFGRSILLAVFAAACLAQVPEPDHSPPPPRLPNGALQSDEMLKEDLAENLKDASQLVELSQQLRTDLAKSGRFVFSLSDRKKAEDIEKLAHKIRMRMDHH